MRRTRSCATPRSSSKATGSRRSTAATRVAERYRGRQFDEVVDGRRLGAVPGFVDTHVHLSETLSRGVFPDILVTRAWVFHWAKPFYAHVDAEDERLSVLLGTAEMLRSRHHLLPGHGGAERPGSPRAPPSDIGIRGITGRHAADRKPEPSPARLVGGDGRPPLLPERRRCAGGARARGRTWNGYADGRIRCWVNIEGKEPCSLELHLGARQLAERLGVGTTYHIASSSRRPRSASAATGAGRSAGSPTTRAWARTSCSRMRSRPPTRRSSSSPTHDTKVAFCPSTSLKLGQGRDQHRPLPRDDRRRRRPSASAPTASRRPGTST